MSDRDLVSSVKKMRPRAGSSVGGASQAGSMHIVMVLVSCLACVYVAGRLWQDAKVRSDFMKWASKRDKGVAVNSMEESMKLLDNRALERKLAVLEMELAAARAKGFVPLAVSSNKSADARSYLAFVGINTGFGQRDRRDSIRNTWLAAGGGIRGLKEKGIIVRFVIGHSANKGDSMDRAIAEEDKETQDFLILQEHVEGYDELPIKTQEYFSIVSANWDADFYFKVDDDVYVNLERLATMLQAHRKKPRVYIGCMKSGEVYTEPSQRWHEPEWWKFGDAKSYFRHATGQIYGLSRAMAQYISINRALLHKYRNEDVSLGSWMIGLETEHIDERRLCCASPPADDCVAKKNQGDGCIAVFDWRCSGLCQSVQRMPEVHKTCS